jgi:hypothetical protein
MTSSSSTINYFNSSCPRDESTGRYDIHRSDTGTLCTVCRAVTPRLMPLLALSSVCCLLLPYQSPFLPSSRRRVADVVDSSLVDPVDLLHASPFPSPSPPPSHSRELPIIQLAIMTTRPPRAQQVTKHESHDRERARDSSGSTVSSVPSLARAPTVEPSLAVIHELHTTRVDEHEEDDERGEDADSDNR